LKEILKLKRTELQKVLELFRKKGISKSDEKELLSLSKKDASKYKRFAQRRFFQEPLAYISGHTIFFNRKFKVDKRVYIPTKETEQLVKLLLNDLSENSIVLDVGTGSGSLAITIKKEKPLVKVFALDIDPNSLIVANENAKQHNANILFNESYYVDDLKIQEPTHIIADLPWGDKDSVLGSNSAEEFKHIPFMACFHPFGKFEAYIELIKSIIKKKWKPKLFIETGLIQKKEIAKIMPKNVEWKYVPFEKYSVTIVQF